MRRLVVLAGLAALVVAGCGGSSRPKGPPDLVFVSTRDGDYALFGANADGKHQHRLTKEKGNPSTAAGLFFQVDPAWSPDGRLILFASARDGVSHLYTIRPDGIGTRRLTNTSQNDGRGAWSPNGRRVVFGREGALFTIPARGGPARRVVKLPGNAADPTYSPDGKLIAFDYRAPGSPVREVYVVNADGSHVRRLTRLNTISGLPVWSPNGRRIAFQSNVRLGHYEVYTIGLDGKGVEQVTVSTVDVIQPAFVPGGGISFSRDGAIWVDRGGKETQLTSSENNDSSPAWRPK